MSNLNAPSASCEPVDLSTADYVPTKTCGIGRTNNVTRALYVGTGGDVKVDFADGQLGVTLKNVGSGVVLPVVVKRIYKTGTTAQNILALF